MAGETGTDRSITLARGPSNMSIFEAIKVTVPCRTCGRAIHCRVRRVTVDDTSMNTPNLIVSCPEHGETRMKLRKIEYRGKETWFYLNKHDVEMGRGETPQEAIDWFHGRGQQPMPDRGEETKKDPGEQGQYPELRDPLEWDALSMGETHKGDRDDDIVRLLEHLPAWFRELDYARQAVTRFLEQGVDAERLFGHRFVVMTKESSSTGEGPVHFHGFDYREEVDELVRRSRRGDDNVVFIRDQKQDEFLEHEITIEVIERTLRRSSNPERDSDTEGTEQ